MKITRFDLLRGPFIDRDQASRREPKIMQNHAKMHPKSPQNEHEKTCIPVSQWPKRHPNPWRVQMRQNAFIFAVPGFTLLGESVKKTCKIYTKRVQIRRKMSTKKHGFRYRKRKKYTPTCIFSIFPCFSRFDQVLEHCLWCFGISLMFFWWFFNFWTSFADFGWIWSKI